MDSITVHVVKYGDRKNLVMRYLCPLTNRQIQRSTGTNLRSKAEKIAAKWEAELQEGRYQRDAKIGWDEFVSYYQANALAALAPGTRAVYAATFNRFKAFCRPQRVADVTTARVTAFVAYLRSDGCTEATVARHLRTIKAMTRWAHKQGLLVKLPQITMPKRARGAKVMRGRPITGEEFDRMLDKAKVRGPEWPFYLRGLWQSGLRLSESLTLAWTDRPESIIVELDGKYPMLRITAEAEKAHKDRLLPMTPQFAELLRSVPEADRRGLVFGVGQCSEDVSRVVSGFGEAAGVIVDDNGKRKKYASAHDLRRAFGARWSRRVMPTVLREMMRHSSLQTTMAYYVGEDANETAKALWEASGTIAGTSGPIDGSEAGGAESRKSLPAR